MKRLTAAIASLCLMTVSAAAAEGMTMQENMRRVAPALEKYTQGTVLGDLWKRRGLSPRDRSVVTVAALVARNQTVDMTRYLNLALDDGVKRGEISEIITHLAFYSGWANAMSAVAVAADIFEARKIGTDQLPAASPALLPLNEAAETERAKRVSEQFGAAGLASCSTPRMSCSATFGCGRISRRATAVL